MATRRQEKIARVVREVVSEVVANDLNDPRIAGFTSVTSVEMGSDLRSAEVYLSIFGADEVAQNKTFIAIKHAKTRIQSLLGSRMRSKFCPVLHFHLDQKLKKTLETMKVIDRAANELKEKDSAGKNIE